MQFILIARDKPEAVEDRLRVRDAHMQGVKRGRAAGWIIDGGALLDANGQMAGSAMLLEFPDRAALDAYLSEEIYATEGVWGEVTVLPMRRVDWDALMKA